MNTMKRSMISTCTGLSLAAALTITSAMSAGATQLTDEDPAHSSSATTQVSEDEALVDVSPSDADTQAVPVIAIIIAVIAMGGSAHAMGPRQRGRPTTRASAMPSTNRSSGRCVQPS